MFNCAWGPHKRTFVRYILIKYIALVEDLLTRDAVITYNAWFSRLLACGLQVIGYAKKDRKGTPAECFTNYLQPTTV